MRRFISSFAILVAGLWTVLPRTIARVNVTQEHNNPSRDGVYIDPAFRSSVAANLTRDLDFGGSACTATTAKLVRLSMRAAATMS